MAYCVLINHCLWPTVCCSPTALPGAPLGASCPRVFSRAVPSAQCALHPALPHLPAGLLPTLAPWWSPRPLPGPPPASGPSGYIQHGPAGVPPRWVLRPSSLPPAPLWVPCSVPAEKARPSAEQGRCCAPMSGPVRELRHLHRRWGDAGPAVGQPRELRHLLQKPLEKTSVRLISVFT